MARRSLVVMLIALAGPVAAVACGGDDSSDSDDNLPPVEVVYAAPGKAVEAGTAKVDIGYEVKGPDRRSSVRTTGEVDFAARAVHLVAEGPTATNEMVLVDGLLFVKGHEGDNWHPLGLAQVPQPEIGQPAWAADPLGQIAALARLDDVKPIGKGKVRGVPASHYRGSRDLLQEPNVTNPVMEVVWRGGLVPVDVWVDDEGHVLKMKITIVNDWEAAAEKSPEFQQYSGLGTDTVTIELEFYDWGADVDIEAPS